MTQNNCNNENTLNEAFNLKNLSVLTAIFQVILG